MSYIASVIKYGFQCDLYDLIRNPNASNKKLLKLLQILCFRNLKI